MLDPNGRKEVIRTVHELNRVEGITMVLITHYMEEVVDADRVIVMDDGHIVMDGTPKEIFSRVEELKQYRMDVPLNDPQLPELLGERLYKRLTDEIELLDIVKDSTADKK